MDIDSLDNPYILLTPGPLSTSKTVRQAMLRDWCTWDDDYNLGVVQVIRQKLVELATASQHQAEYTSVLMQGSGTFAVESRIGNICPECSMLRSLRVADLDGTGVADEVIVTASVGKPSLRLMTVLNPLATEPTIVATHEAVLSMIEIGDWNEDGVSDIAFSNADLSLGILLSNP